MLERKCLVPLFILTFLLMVVSHLAFAQFEIDPYGFAVSLEEGENSEVDFIISNPMDCIINFEISSELIENEDRRRGPRRDDLGEVIRSIEVHDGRWIGLAWDGELLWGSDQHDNWRMTPVNMDGDVLDQVDVEFTGYYGSCWDGENFWLAHYNESRLARIDREGRLLNAVQVNAQPFGMTWDGETLWYARYQAQDIQQMTVEGEVLRTWDCNDIQSRRTMELAWVPDHPEGHLWITACDPGTIYQVNTEPDPPEVVQTVNVEDNNVYGLDHDGEYLWYTTDRGEWICIDDGVAEVRMLVFDPDEGEIQGQDVVELVANILIEGVEAGIYEFLVEVLLFDPENEDIDPETLTMSVLISIDSPTADLRGVVSSSRDDEVIPDAEITMDRFEMIRYTDNNGRYSLNSLLTGAYTFTVSAEDYLTQAFEFNIDGEGEIELNFELAQSECNIVPELIDVELGPEEESRTVIEMSNTGNGPLTFITERRLIGDANADPWELRLGYPAGEITNDSRVQGVVFTGDQFYLSGANNREPLIYVLNRDQEIVDQYDQHGESRYGYKDLAFDGELIWGSGERIVYGFTPEGELDRSFDCGISPCNNLAWDSDRDILWGSGTTTDIIGFDRDGNQIEELDRGEFRIYGLAYWPDDPDGHQLYIFHKINDVGDLMVAKLNIENGEIVDVISLEHEDGGAAQGCFITNQYDIYSWVFMGVANSGAEDRIDIWQLDARKDWMAIEPIEGVIGAGEQRDIIVTLDAAGLPEAVFEGEILFTHDGIGGQTHLPITLQVGEGGGDEPEEMVLNLDDGWNMVSSYVQPDPDDIREITAALVEAGTLIMMKNSVGQFYNPQFNFNNIPGWRVNEGYMIKMDGADELILNGISVAWNEPLELQPGWQMISYYPRQGVDAIVALSGIVDLLLMAKDGQGRFYSPAFEFSNMGDMVPGQGYLVKMDEAAELVYTVEDELASYSISFAQTSILPVHDNTGENMSLLILSDISEGEVGVYSGDIMVGSGVIQKGKCGISVWGNDPSTPERDGAQEKETIKLRLYRETGEEFDLQYETLTGRNIYETNSLWVVELDEIVNPHSFGIKTISPNPFNSVSRLTFDLSNDGLVNLGLYDVDGRRILDLTNGHLSAGSHSISIDGSDLASGLYFMRLRAGSQSDSRKITLIK